MILDAQITYRSKEPVHKKPAIFSTGGYAVETQDKKTIIFDWLNWHGDSSILEDGRIEIRAYHDLFDTDFTIDSSDEGIDINALTSKELTRMLLTDVTYECFADDAEEEPIDLIVTEFLIESDDAYDEYQAFKDLSHINQ